LSGLALSILLDKVTSKQVATMTDKTTMELEIPVETYESHMIDKPLRPELAKALGVPDSNFYLNSLIADFIAKSMVAGPENELSGVRMAEAVKVTQRSVVDGTSVANGMVSLPVGAHTYVASQNNIIAFNAISSIQATQLMTRVGKPRVFQLSQMMVNMTPEEIAADKTLSAMDKAVIALDIELIEQFLQDEMDDPNFLVKVLGALAN
ncbi:MAG: hypothetical protein AB7O96_09155, partial [Pseudobdellovibrionaceae bacterium]